MPKSTPPEFFSDKIKITQVCEKDFNEESCRCEENLLRRLGQYRQRGYRMTVLWYTMPVPQVAIDRPRRQGRSFPR